MRLSLAAAPLLAALACAAPAHAAWTVRVLPTGEQAFLRGLGARSDQQPQLVDARRHDGAWRLELRSGRSYRNLDTSAHQAEGVRIGHDDRNGVIVAWDRATGVGHASGPRQLFVWTTHGGTRQLTHGTHSVSLFDLDEAADGTTILGLYSAGAVQVVRHGPRTDAFGAVETLSAPGASPGFPAVGAGMFGHVVVAWAERDHIVARAVQHANLAPPADGGAFGPAQVVAPPADPGGAALDAASPTVVMGPQSRAVVAFQTSLQPLNAGITGRRVDAFDWPADAPAPSAARTLSLSTWASAPQLIEHGGIADLAWTETGSKSRPAHALRSVRWPEDGAPGPVTTYRPRQNLGSTAKPIVLQPMPGTAIRAYWQPSVGGRFQTVTLDDQGRPSGAATITGPQGYVADAHAALTSSGSMLAWTHPGLPYRVVTARP